MNLEKEAKWGRTESNYIDRPTRTLKGGSSIDAMGQSKGLMDPSRLPWLICFGLSLVYLFVFIGGNPISEFFHQGFCVHGWVPSKNECNKPSSQLLFPSNSHFYSWSVEIVFTLLAIYLGFFSGLSESPLAIKISIVGIIFGHGLLHCWLSHIGCNPPVDIGQLFYNIFAFALVSLNILGFSSIPLWQSAIWIPTITWLIVKLTNSPSLGNKAISTLFMVSHLLVSFTFLFHPKEGVVTELTGWLFILPCVTALVEFLDCDFLVRYGGHMWYDLTLHISVISSLLGPNCLPWRKSRMA